MRSPGCAKGIGLPWLIFVTIFFCMPQLGLGGVVDGDGLSDGLRQRNIFPLPKITGSGGSGTQSTPGWEGLANAGIKALNDLSGCLIDFSQKKPTKAQRRILQHISDSYRDCSVDDSIDPGRSCLEDLCSSSRLYQVDRSDVVSYSKDLVSWPEASSRPVALEGCLGPADREWLATWREQMLRPDDAGKIEGLVKPYTDPILKHNKQEYAGFICELYKRNMIRFQVCGEHQQHPALGIFFVKKKNGKQRLIFDTRVLNQKFIDPPSTDLPSADSFTRLEIPEGQQFFTGSGDLANAFYTLEVPDELGRLFTLPAIEAGLLKLDSKDLQWRRGTSVVPYLTVLPMGWAWALHFCQGVLTNAISSCGFGVNQMISDKTNPVHLGSHDDLAVAGYVDNFAVIGCNPNRVNSGLTKIGNHLRALGLTVHEEADAELSADFVGLHFDGSTGFVSIKPQRILKLQRAIRELLNRNFASGELLQLILGHITWAMMSRREGLSILSSCYAFSHRSISKACRLWPSVRRELEWVAALLPLFRAKINVGWSSDVLASDSSPYGYGVCQRQLPTEVVKGIGSQSERWRFRFEDAVDARSHAAKSGGVEVLDKDNISGFNVDAFDSILQGLNKAGFHEVPSSILKQDDWNIVWSAPWQRHDNILRTEGLALVWAIEHSLRANRNLGKKLLFLCDNLPLALSASKGRARSGYLVHALRKVCALTLASGSKCHTRWIPSEWNSADKPSRALTQWSSRGLTGWFSEQRDLADSYGHRRSQRPEVKRKTTGSKTAGCFEQPGSNRPDIPRDSKCEEPHFEGLPETTGPLQPVACVSAADANRSKQHGQLLGRVPPGHVRRWEGGERRSEDSGSHSLLSPIHGDKPDEICSSFEGLAVSGPAFAENATANRGVDCNHGGDADQGLRGGALETLSPVYDLPETWRMQQFACEAVGCSSAVSAPGVQLLGDPPQSQRGLGSRQDRRVRWVRDHRFRHVDRPFSSSAGSRPRSKCTSLEIRPCVFEDTVQQRGGVPWTSRAGSHSLHSEARGGHPRHPRQKKNHAGDQAKRTLEQRCVLEAVCETGQASNRASKSFPTSERVWGSHFKEFALPLAKSKNDSSSTHWNSQVTHRMRRRRTVPVKGPKSLTGCDML